MLGATLFHLTALVSFAQICLPLPVGDSSLENREASPQWLPGAGETAQQAEGTIRGEQSHSGSFSIPKEKRTALPDNIEEDYPLTHAMLKMIRDAIPEQSDELVKRQNSSSSGGSGSGIPGLSNLDPQTQSTLKDTIRYGIALVMKTGSWALSP